VYNVYLHSLVQIAFVPLVCMVLNQRTENRNRYDPNFQFFGSHLAQSVQRLGCELDTHVNMVPFVAGAVRTIVSRWVLRLTQPNFKCYRGLFSHE